MVGLCFKMIIANAVVRVRNDGVLDLGITHDIKDIDRYLGAFVDLADISSYVFGGISFIFL